MMIERPEGDERLELFEPYGNSRVALAVELPY
jgi:hypothetical protein